MVNFTTVVLINFPFSFDIIFRSQSGWQTIKWAMTILWQRWSGRCRTTFLIIIFTTMKPDYFPSPMEPYVFVLETLSFVVVVATGNFFTRLYQTFFFSSSPYSSLFCFWWSLHLTEREMLGRCWISFTFIITSLFRWNFDMALGFQTFPNFLMLETTIKHHTQRERYGCSMLIQSATFYGWLFLYHFMSNELTNENKYFRIIFSPSLEYSISISMQ